MRGSVFLQRINDNVTSMEMIFHLDALQERGANARSYVNDFVNEVQLFSTDMALPEY